MIGSLTGTVEQVASDSMLLQVGGVGPGPRSLGAVGYRVFVLPPLLASVKTGDTLTVYTHLHVREDELSLYGFRTMRELAFFELLLQAPGVGPKSALGVMTISSIDTLIRGITGGDVELLTKVAGIGRKTAERIVVELKARLEKAHPDLVGTQTSVHADVVTALVGLGYTTAQAREIARQLPPEIESVEEGIRTALKALGPRTNR